MWRTWLILLCGVLAVGCSPRALPTIQSVALVQSEGEEDGWPSRVVLQVEVDNPSSRVTLLSGRVRVSYAARRVAMLTLEDRVVVPARQRSVIDVPLHVAVQRTSQTMAFREAIEQHRSEQISVDWQVALRSRMAYVRTEQPPQPIDEVLSQEQLQILWNLIEEK